MKSMTGFHSIERVEGNYNFSLMLKSYNGKNFDLKLKIPEILLKYELTIREFINSYIKRGSIFLKISLEEREPSLDFKVNLNYISKIKEVKETLESEGLLIDSKINLSDFMHLKAAFLFKEEASSSDELWKALEPLIRELLEEHDKFRIEEGKNLERDLISNINIIKGELDFLNSNKETLKQELFSEVKTNILKLIENVEDDKVLEEAAKIALRMDINEELIRLNSHIVKFLNVLKEDSPVGKILDFLSQEMQREANTISSKLVSLAFKESILNMKIKIEELKEQVRNLE